MGKCGVIALLAVSMLADLPDALHAQPGIGKVYGSIRPVICYADDEPSDRHIPPPETYRAWLKSGQEAGSIFEINLTDAPDPQANDAAQVAADIWASLVYSPVPVRVEVKFRNLQVGVLGSTSPDGAYYVDDNGHLPERIYYTALAEKLWDRNLNGNLPDINVLINSSKSWYFGTDGKLSPNQFDFLSILLHEIAHGMGFLGGFRVDGNGLGLRSSIPVVFDHFLENAAGERLSDTLVFPPASPALGNQLQSSPVYFKSPLAFREYNEIPTLFVPDPWDNGSSLYHLDEVYNEKNGGRDAMMTFSTSPGEVVHDPGPVTRMMLWEMGWLHTYIMHDSLLDREDLADPFTIGARIVGDPGADPSDPYVFFAVGDQELDSVAMTASGIPDEFAADIPLSDTGVAVQYYIRATDGFGREYSLPAGTAGKPFRFYVGRDTIFPVIEHKSLGFMLISADSVEVGARIMDNLGIDTAQVEYKINDAEQPPFDLYPDTLTEYKGHFVFTPGQINPGDVIHYRIRAVDGSQAQNSALHPEKGFHSFTAEDIPMARDEYQNDFESGVEDFLISDGFSRQKPDGFDSYALHSDHPYPEPGNDNVNWDFIAQLKVPVRLNPENPYMTFEEVAFIEPGNAGTVWGDDDFFDYVIVEGSTDGSHWHALTAGYDCRAYSSWKSAYGEPYSWIHGTSITVPTQTDVKTRLVDLIADTPFGAGDVILIRFRLHSDPYANGWGWMIDRLKIQAPGTSVPEYQLVPDAISVFPNPSSGLLSVNVQLKEGASGLEIILTDMLGRHIIREEYPDPGREFSREFRLDGLPEGVYLMQFRSGDQRVMKKIILAR